MRAANPLLSFRELSVSTGIPVQHVHRLSVTLHASSMQSPNLTLTLPALDTPDPTRPDPTRPTICTPNCGSFCALEPRPHYHHHHHPRPRPHPHHRPYRFDHPRFTSRTGASHASSTLSSPTTYTGYTLTLTWPARRSTVVQRGTSTVRYLR